VPLLGRGRPCYESGTGKQAACRQRK